MTFSVDGSAVTAHRLVMRVIREQAAARNELPGICAAAVGLLEQLAGSLERSSHVGYGMVRDLEEQITALHEASAACPGDSTRPRLIRLREWAE